MTDSKMTHDSDAEVLDRLIEATERRQNVLCNSPEPDQALFDCARKALPAIRAPQSDRAALQARVKELEGKIKEMEFRADALADLNYARGVAAGWNCESALERDRIIAAIRGQALRALQELKAPQDRALIDGGSA